jgi:hypothetical protein
MRFGKPIKNVRRNNPRYFTVTEGVQFENNSHKNMNDVTFYLEELYPFCKEALGFEEDATIVFESDRKNAKDPLGKTAFYDPANRSISVYVDGRHTKDIMRSVTHELVHHHQNLRGDLNGASMEEGYAQSDDHLREMEREAYEKGNLLFRDWEDNKKSNGDDSVMARVMEKWGYNANALTEEGASFEEGQLVTITGSALTFDGEKTGTVVSFEDPAVTVKLDDDQEGKYVPDDKMVKVKKDYVEARVDSGFDPVMGASEDETLGEDMYDDDIGGDDFDMDSLESEFPWLAKDVKGGNVPPELAAELAAEFGDKPEPEEEPEDVIVMKEGDFVGHHAEIDGKTYVDSNFLNSVRKVRDTFPHELKHMGGGNFYLETPKGKIQFDRSRGQSVQGTVRDFVGRAHYLYGEPPELADELMAAMEAAGASAEASITGVGGSDSEGYSKVAGTRPMEEEAQAPKLKKGDTVYAKGTDPADGVGVVQAHDPGATEVEVYWQSQRKTTTELVDDLAPAPDRGSQGERPYTASLDDLEENESGAPSYILYLKGGTETEITLTDDEWNQFGDSDPDQTPDDALIAVLMDTRPELAGDVEDVERVNDLDLSMEEAGRPHSMRGGRAMADLDREASMREKDPMSNISKKDFVRSVMDKGKVPNLKGDMGPIPGMEGPYQFKSGAVLYYDTKTGEYYDRGKDMYLDRDEAAELTMEEGSDGKVDHKKIAWMKAFQAGAGNPQPPPRDFWDTAAHLYNKGGDPYEAGDMYAARLERGQKDEDPMDDFNYQGSSHHYQENNDLREGQKTWAEYGTDDAQKGRPPSPPAPGGLSPDRREWHEYMEAYETVAGTTVGGSTGAHMDEDKEASEVSLKEQPVNPIDEYIQLFVQEFAGTKHCPEPCTGDNIRRAFESHPEKVDKMLQDLKLPPEERKMPYHQSLKTEISKASLKGDNEMNLEEIVRGAVRKALKEKKYRREDEDEEGEEVNETLREAPDQNVEIVGSLIHQHGFMNAREALEQTGFKVDFVTSPLPMYVLEKDGVKYAALNKKYAEDPDLVVGETAIGVMNEELSAKQKKLDLDDDGNIDPEDLKGLRAGKEDEDVGKEEEKKDEAKTEGKLPPGLAKFQKGQAEADSDDEDTAHAEADDDADDEKNVNESASNKDWYDDQLFSSLMKKWSK